MYRLLSIILIIISISAVALTPTLIIKNTKQCGYVMPSTSTYQKEITATGQLSSSDKREIFIPTPVIPSNVQFEVGDVVSSGDIIAEIDMHQTESLLKNSISSNIGMLDINTEDFKDISSMLAGVGMGISDIESISQLLPTIKSMEKTYTATIPNKISSPIDGTITAMNLQTGVLCQPIGASIVVEDLSVLNGIVYVNESDINSIKVGQEVSISGSGFSDQEVLGYVSKIYPTVEKDNQSSGNVKVGVSIPNDNQSLKSGFSITANIKISNQRSAFSLPYEAVKQDNNNLEFVYVLEEGRAVKRYVDTGEEMTNSIEIVKGLGTEDVVLFNPMDINDGTLVLVKEDLS